MVSQPSEPGASGFLLDTHVALWWQSDAHRLSARIHGLLTDLDQRVVFSAASLWEIAIKQSIGKLKVEQPFFDIVSGGGLELLSVSPQHTAAVRHLPFHHTDPFDRMLVAQAQTENLTLITADKRLAAYDTPVLPAT